MRKILSLFVALTAVLSLSAKTVYLNPGQTGWADFNAVTFIHSWGGSATIDVKMLPVEEGSPILSADCGDNTQIIFVRAQGDCQTIPWDTDNLWNKTEDLTIPDDRNMFVASSFSDKKANGAWGVYGAKFYITGTSNLLEDAGSTASEWASNAIVSMNDSYILTDLKKDKTYKLLVTVDGTWNTKRQFDNLTDTVGGLFLDSELHICFRLAADGNVTVNYTNSVFTLSGNFAAPTVGIVGNFEGNTTWALQPEYTMTPTGDKKSASVTFNVNEETYEMKVWEDGSFLSVNGDNETLFQINSNDCCNHVDNVNLYNTGRNFEFVANKTGNYTFTWTYATRNLVVTYPTTPTAIDNTEAEGKAVKRIVNGQLVIEKNGVRYNALGIEVK